MHAASRFAWLCLVVAWLCTLSRTAWAAEPCDDSRPRFIKVAFSGTPLEPELRQQLLEQLAASFRRRELAVCDRERSEPAVATIVFDVSGESSVVVDVEVVDSVTNKRLARPVDVVALDDPGKALALAIGAEELVLAAWAELALQTAAAQESATREPPEVERAVTEELHPTRSSQLRVTIAGQGAVEHYGVGQTLLGGDLLVGARFTRRVGLELSLGGRAGLPIDVAQGRVQTRALGGTLGVPIGLVEGRRAGVVLVPAMRIVQVHASGTSEAAEVLVQRAAGTAVVGRLQLQGRLTPAWPLTLDLRLGAGVPVRSFEARVDGEAVGGVSGFELSGALSIGVMFPR